MQIRALLTHHILSIRLANIQKFAKILCCQGYMEARTHTFSLGKQKWFNLMKGNLANYICVSPFTLRSHFKKNILKYTGKNPKIHIHTSCCSSVCSF